MRASTVNERFRIVLPPGWARIDLTVEVEPDEVVSTLTGGAAVPVQVRESLAAQLATTLRGAVDLGARCVILPTDPEYGGSTTLMFRPFEHAGTPLDELVSLVAAEPSATMVDVPDLVCVRVSRVRRQEATDLSEFTGQAGQAASAAVLGKAHSVLQVRYVLGHPDQPASWVEVLGGIGFPQAPEAQEAVDALLALADGIVSTFRWVA